MASDFFQLLILIIVANGAPILAHFLLQDRFATAIDFGQVFFDGNPVFGQSKTWRGLAVSLLMTALTAVLLGHSVELGILLSLYAMAGDLLSSFIKRRRHIQPSGRALFIDQVPESLLPAWLMMDTFNIKPGGLVGLVLVFIVLELLLSKIFYRLKIRKRPY